MGMSIRSKRLVRQLAFCILNKIMEIPKNDKHAKKKLETAYGEILSNLLTDGDKNFPSGFSLVSDFDEEIFIVVHIKKYSRRLTAFISGESREVVLNEIRKMVEAGHESDSVDFSETDHFRKLEKKTGLWHGLFADGN